MTTCNTINNNTLLCTMLLGRASKQARVRYELDMYCMTVLYSCCIYGKYIKPLFTVTDIRSFVTYYNNGRIKIYINRLVNCSLLSIDSSTGKYFITQLGIDSIIEVSNNLDQLIYSFCGKYNIEL